MHTYSRKKNENMKTEERSRRQKPKKSHYQRQTLLSLGDISFLFFMFLFFYFLFSYLLVFCLHACIQTTCAPGALRGQKRTLDPLWANSRQTGAVSGCWKPNPDTPQEQRVLWAAEPSQPFWGYFLLNMFLLTYYCVWCGGGTERGMCHSSHTEGRWHIRRRVAFLLLSLSNASGHSEVRQPPNVKHHWK